MDRGLRPLKEVMADYASPEGQRLLDRVEQSYRRGYAHGYHAALDEIESLIRRGYSADGAVRTVSRGATEHTERMKREAA